MKTPTTLIIMDGFALGDEIPGNAVRAAKTPHLDDLFSQYPFCQLSASGYSILSSTSPFAIAVGPAAARSFASRMSFIF